MQELQRFHSTGCVYFGRNNQWHHRREVYEGRYEGKEIPWWSEGGEYGQFDFMRDSI